MTGAAVSPKRAASAEEAAVTDDLIQFALHLADAARAETLGRFAACVPAQDKSGGGAEFDPVTEADRAAERAMRTLIEQAHPDHGITGEEFAERAADSAFTWSLDPVDGTRSFTCGLPTWVTLIALLEHGEPVLGMIDAPRLGERYVGLCNDAWLESPGGREPLRTSGCVSLSEARLSTTDPYLFAGAGADAFERLRVSVRTTRYGHDGYGYARLAADTIDLVVECGLKPHDYNALVPVVRGAGGTIGDWTGGTDLAPGRVIAAATRELYDCAVEFMRAAG